MRHQPSVFVAVLTGLAGLVFGLMLGQPTSGQRPAPTPLAAHPGRFQMAVGGSANPYVIVTDTSTGHCWSHSAGGGDWTDLGTPAGK